MQNGKAASWSGGCRPGRLALRGVSGQVPERLADQNSGPRVGGHQRWVFPLCIEHKRKWGFWGAGPTVQTGISGSAVYLGAWPCFRGTGEVRQTQGAGLGQLGHGDSPMTSPRGGLFREFQSVVSLLLPMSKGRSRCHRIPYVSCSSGHLSACSPSYNVLIL